MNFEKLKEEFISYKKEEFEYLDSIAKISSQRKLSEFEKIEVFRKLKYYENLFNKLFIELKKVFFSSVDLEKVNYNDVIIEFPVDKDFLSSIDFGGEVNRICELRYLGIDERTFNYKLTARGLSRFNYFKSISQYLLQNYQDLIEKPIYIFNGYYDASQDCFGPCFGEHIYGCYRKIMDTDKNDIDVLESNMPEYEKDKIIIESKSYVSVSNIDKIFEEELLNIENNSLDDCVVATRKRVEELSYINSPEYKEKVLLDKINELYYKVKGELIDKEVLYNGKFLDVFRETYKLPNDKVVCKERIKKNNGKNSVIVFAITKDDKYIITFQNRINDKIIAEFPSGYIEDNEDVFEAAKRELKEETGYISDDLFIIDEVYSSLSIDDSTTYLVVANNCVKTDEKRVDGTELVNYGLFSEKELKYLISSNIMKGAMNRLAYYILNNKFNNCNVTYLKSEGKILKREYDRINPRDVLL